MDPVILDSIVKQPKLPWKRLILPAILLFLVSAIFYGIYSGKIPNPIPLANNYLNQLAGIPTTKQSTSYPIPNLKLLTPPGIQKIPTFGDRLKTSLQTSFAINHPEIVQTVQAASNTDEDTAYQNLLSAYSQMIDVYNQTKDPQVKTAIINLKNYSLLFHNYKESDMEILR